MKEVWKVHPEFGAYEISDRGKVRRIGVAPGAKVGRILKLFQIPKGYFFLRLHNKYNKYIHRLVLEAFVGECPEGFEARHLDGDKGNNNLSNLCWGTHAENQVDRVRHGMNNNGSKHGLSKLTENDVLQIRARYIPRVVTQQMLADEFGVVRPNISMILSRNAWAHI